MEKSTANLAMQVKIFYIYGLGENSKGNLSQWVIDM